MKHVKACKPVLEIKAQCYHMETHVRHVTKKDGTTRRDAWSNLCSDFCEEFQRSFHFFDGWPL